MPDTHDDIRRRLFNAAWETPAYAPAPERTVSRARRRAAATIGGGVLAAILVIVVAASSLPVDMGDRTGGPPTSTDHREFLVDVRSGKTTEIWDTPSMEGAAWPVISPNGQQVAFISEAAGGPHVSVANLDGTDLRPVSRGFAGVGGPTWSPDGQDIAFWALDRSAVRNIHVVHLETGRTRTITHEAQDLWALDWSPDGRSILYTTAVATSQGETDGFYFPNLPGYQVRRVDVGTGEVEKVFGRRGAYGWDGTWTPEGIMFVRGREVRGGQAQRFDLAVLDATGAPARSIFEFDLEHGGEVYAPMLSPDGTMVAYARPFEGQDHVFLLDVATGQTRDLRLGSWMNWVDADTLLVQDRSHRAG